MTIKNNGDNNGVIAKKVTGPINIYNNFKETKKISSLLPNFIEILSDIYLKSTDPSNNDGIPIQYNIEDKIEYNNLIRYKYIVEDYGLYYTICSTALNIVDNNKIGSKKKILNSIREYYREEKRDLLSRHNFETIEIDIIRANADSIIDAIKSKLEKTIYKYYNNEKLDYEDIAICCPIFICYAFAECKILERPPKNDYIKG